jgi:hypothetical protein
LTRAICLSSYLVGWAQRRRVLRAGAIPAAEADTARVAALQRYTERGQALVETALVIPVLLVLAFGVVGAARVTQAQMGVSAVSREAARIGALAASPAEAVAQATARGQEVATGYRLTNGTLRVAVDPGMLPRGGQVQVVARYELTFDDLPLLAWARLAVQSSHAEPIDPFRSR